MPIVQDQAHCLVSEPHQRGAAPAQAADGRRTGGGRAGTIARPRDHEFAISGRPGSRAPSAPASTTAHQPAPQRAPGHSGPVGHPSGPPPLPRWWVVLVPEARGRRREVRFTEVDLEVIPSYDAARSRREASEDTIDAGYRLREW